MLNDLLESQNSSIEITGITVDSRRVQKGYLFAAFPGNQVDGRKFIPQAIQSGCAALLVPSDTDLDADTPCLVIKSENVRKTFAQIAARFYQKQPANIAAVTGTNGKSSTVTFVRQLLELLGQKAASVGTLGISAPGLNISGGLTTPDAAGLHERLSELVDHGVDYLAMEASSHGLDQYRMDGVHVNVAAFTNLSRDHLDYHATMEEYLAAKTRLFSELLNQNGIAVLNADSDTFDHLKSSLKGQRIISYGHKGEDLCLQDVQVFEEGQKLSLKANGQSFDITLPLAGHFQIENALCAAGMVIAHGFEAKDVLPLLSKLQGVPGRLEHMGRGVYVDYAHTPDALKTALEALRPHCSGKLHVIFGCGGDRDRGKRPEMGRIAEQFSDHVIVTDDNPRSEDATLIRQEILAACPNGLEIADRKQAILHAIDQMKAGDCLLIAGKGHETGQIVGDQILPFDDREIAKGALHG